MTPPPGKVETVGWLAALALVVAGLVARTLNDRAERAERMER